MIFKNKIKKSKKNKKIYRKRFNTKKKKGGLAPPSGEPSKPDSEPSTPDIAGSLKNIRQNKYSLLDKANGVADGTTAANHAILANKVSQHLGIQPGFLKQGIAKLLIKAVPQLNILGEDKLASLVSDKAIGNIEQTITKLAMTAVTAIPIPDIGELADIPADFRQFWIDAGVIAEEAGEIQEALKIVQQQSGKLESGISLNAATGISGFSIPNLKTKIPSFKTPSFKTSSLPIPSFKTPSLKTPSLPTPSNPISKKSSQQPTKSGSLLSKDEETARNKAIKACEPRLKVTNDEEEYEQCVKERTKYILEKAADEKLVRSECKVAKKNKEYESIKDCIDEKVSKRNYARAECKKNNIKDTEIENCINEKIEGAKKQAEKKKQLQEAADNRFQDGNSFGGKKTKKKLNKKNKTIKRVFKSNKKGKKDKNTKKNINKKGKKNKKTKKK